MADEGEGGNTGGSRVTALLNGTMELLTCGSKGNNGAGLGVGVGVVASWIVALTAMVGCGPSYAHVLFSGSCKKTNQFRDL